MKVYGIRYIGNEPVFKVSTQVREDEPFDNGTLRSVIIPEISPGLRRCNSAIALSTIPEIQAESVGDEFPIMARLKCCRNQGMVQPIINDVTDKESSHFQNCGLGAALNSCCSSEHLLDADNTRNDELSRLESPETNTKLQVYLSNTDDVADNLQRENSSKDFGTQDGGMRYKLVVILSGLYGLMLSVLGLVIPIAQSFLMTSQSFFFEMFYIYLYTVSMVFLVFVYLFLLHKGSYKLKKFASVVSVSGRSMESLSGVSSTTARLRKKTVRFGGHRTSDTGSFYLRLGAMGFGIGSMILDGLYVGQYFEAQTTHSVCDNPMQAVKPLSKFLFTFSQLYFIFRNSKMCIMKFPYIARFGLMHMSVTNICVWLRVIVVETLHSFHKASSRLETEEHGEFDSLHDVNGSDSIHNDHHDDDQQDPCQWSNLIGGVLRTATPYLYPFSIEYSVICAGVLYVMWSNVGGQKRHTHNEDSTDNDDLNIRHKMSIDCAGSSRGLFLGILAFVVAIISLIVFYVLIQNNSFNNNGILIVHISEITMYSIAILSTIAAGVRMRNLCFRKNLEDNLEQNLILISLTGLYMFSLFSILAGLSYINSIEGAITIVTNLICMTQATLQTMFMLVGLRMSALNMAHVKSKNGREFVTFLLICNFSLWLINTFETQKAAHNPLQLKVYGHQAWAVFTHISVPLGIFYRFHSTVCLSNIWKHAWKIKNR